MKSAVGAALEKPLETVMVATKIQRHMDLMHHRQWATTATHAAPPSSAPFRDLGPRVSMESRGEGVLDLQ